MRTLRIDSKTVLEIRDNKDPEIEKKDWLEKLDAYRHRILRSRIYFAE